MGCLAMWLVALLALGPTLWIEDDWNSDVDCSGQLEAIAKKHGATTPDEQYPGALPRVRRERGKGTSGLCERRSPTRNVRGSPIRSHVGPEHYTHLFQLLARLQPQGARGDRCPRVDRQPRPRRPARDRNQ